MSELRLPFFELSIAHHEKKMQPSISDRPNSPTLSTYIARLARKMHSKLDTPEECGVHKSGGKADFRFLKICVRSIFRGRNTN